MQQPDGAYEIIQFANAELVDEDTYELSRLLRGQGGSEGTIAESLAPGATFVLLDQQIVPVAQGLDMLGRPLSLRVVAAGRDHGDMAVVTTSITPQNTALRPYAPVHLRAQRGADGILLSWIRRTRTDGDSWEAVDVPLGEGDERYEIDILDGGVVKRVLTADSARVLYPAAAEIEDFGAMISTMSLRVFQISNTVGRGFPAEDTIAVA